DPEYLQHAVTELAETFRGVADGSTDDPAVLAGLGLSMGIGLLDALFRQGIRLEPDTAGTVGTRAEEGLPADLWVAGSLRDLQGVLPVGGAALLLGGGRSMVLADTSKGQRLAVFTAGEGALGEVVVPSLERVEALPGEGTG